MQVVYGILPEVHISLCRVLCAGWNIIIIIHVYITAEIGLV